MLFEELFKKIVLLKEAADIENSIENLNDRIAKLRTKDINLNNTLLKQEANIAKTKSQILEIKNKAKILSSEEELFQTALKEKESVLVTLKKKWDALSKEEQTLIKYFSSIS